MRIIVPDASVLLKWVLSTEEENVDQALAIREAFLQREVILVVPSLWLYEVGNQVMRHLPAHSQEILEIMMNFGLIESEPTDIWLNHVTQLVKRYHVTFYDAAYHAVALVEKGTFVTADGKYVKKAFPVGRILALSDWDKS